MPVPPARSLFIAVGESERRTQNAGNNKTPFAMLGGLILKQLQIENKMKRLNRERLSPLSFAWKQGRTEINNR